MRVQSAVDMKSHLVIFSAIAFVTAAFLYLTVGAGFSPYELAIGIGAILAASAFLLWILLGTYYVLCEDCLYCKSGPFSEVILFDDIRYLSLSDNFQASMALSSRRIVIRQYDEEYTMISPRCRERFLRNLKSRCRYLEDETPA
jgi:uncharacterized protein (DUF1810 family)